MYAQPGFVTPSITPTPAGSSSRVPLMAMPFSESALINRSLGTIEGIVDVRSGPSMAMPMATANELAYRCHSARLPEITMSPITT